MLFSGTVLRSTLRVSSGSGRVLRGPGLLVRRCGACIRKMRWSAHASTPRSRQMPSRMRTLPPSSGPTQVRTTPGVAFRAVVELDGRVEMGVAL
jgi:hypothetical protein